VVGPQLGCKPTQWPRRFQSGPSSKSFEKTESVIVMTDLLQRLYTDDAGQDIAEYAVMLAVILVLVVGTIRLVGTNSNTVFSNAASSIQ
jgi:Flp pilus assembly pilin Flp